MVHIENFWLRAIRDIAKDGFSFIDGFYIEAEEKTNELILGVSFDYPDDVNVFLDDIALEVAGSEDRLRKYRWLIDKLFDKGFDKVRITVQEIVSSIKKTAEVPSESIVFKDKPNYIVVEANTHIKIPQKIFETEDPEEQKDEINKFIEEHRETLINFYRSLRPVAEYHEESYTNEEAWRTRILTIRDYSAVAGEIIRREWLMSYPSKMVRQKGGSYRLYIPLKIVELATAGKTRKEVPVIIRGDNGKIEIIIS